MKLDTAEMRTLTIRDLAEYAEKYGIRPSEILAGPAPRLVALERTA